jgi:hypothetical protein
MSAGAKKFPGLLLLGKADIIQKLGVPGALYFHEKAEGVGSAFVLQDGKWLPTLGRTLVNDIDLVWRVLFEEISQYEFSLRFAIGLNISIQRHVYRTVEVTGELFRAARLDRFLDLCNHIALGKTGRSQHQEERRNDKKF